MFSPRTRIRAAALAAPALLVGCASLSHQPVPEAAFVVLGEEGAPLARAVTTASGCPAIEIDGRALPMAVRAPFGPIPPRAKGHSATFHPEAASRPVLACETPIPAGSTRVAVAGQVLPLPVADVKRIVVIGDTGCRLKGKEFQDCNEPDAYPFARVAASAAAWKPDLVVHVGDYHYREDPCPADRPGCAGSPYGYGWDAWNADFFAPGRALLAAAPWVLARGNHETCARAGQGWWRFLDPHRYDPAANCDDPAADDRADYADPYAVPLGGGAQLIVFDTANTDWKGFGEGDVRIARYTDAWRRIDRLARRQPYNIGVDHHPLYAFGAVQDAHTGAVTLFGGDAGLTQVFGALDARLLPRTIAMLLSGHVHRWEQTSFASDHPTQFVAGFAGTAEDTVPLPATPPAGRSPAPGAVLEAMNSWNDGFGFMTLERTGPDRWRVAVHDLDGKERTVCTVTGRHSACANTLRQM
jgi:hypothetical protein